MSEGMTSYQPSPDLPISGTFLYPPTCSAIIVPEVMASGCSLFVVFQAERFMDVLRIGSKCAMGANTMRCCRSAVLTRICWKRFGREDAVMGLRNRVGSVRKLVLGRPTRLVLKGSRS